MADLLHFALDLAQHQAARDRFRGAPERVLDDDVDDAGTATGEDVEAVAELLRRRLPPARAALVELAGPVRPAEDETPRDAAVRLLLELAGALDGRAVEPVTLPHRELRPDPPPPRETARGGGEPVPTRPPGGRWLHPVIPDDDQP